MDKLSSAFNDYMEQCKNMKILQIARVANITIIPNEDYCLRTAIESLEKQENFQRLILAARDSFSRSEKLKDHSHWGYLVRNILRRSRIYIDCVREAVTNEQLLERFSEAFLATKMTVVQMALLELVSFSNETICFDKFQIKKFSIQELELFTENEVRRIFYPWAVLDVKTLSQYWWLISTKEADSPDIEKNFFFTDLGNFDFSGKVERKYSDLTVDIVQALKAMTLYDWKQDHVSSEDEMQQYITKETKLPWFGFKIPFSIQFDNCLVQGLREIGSIGNLQVEPKFNSDNEEVGVGPIEYFYLDDEETVNFQRIVAKYENQLDSILKQKDWHFVDIALGYLVKAFFSEGLDQLLWHITVVEALFGEKVASLTDTLARRCSRILGKTKQQRKDVSKSFKDLYEFRSNLVHGNFFEADVYDGHLFTARKISRAVANWFVNYLSQILDQMADVSVSLPERTQLINLVDMDVKQRDHIQIILNCIPPGFPENDCWKNEK